MVYMPLRLQEPPLVTTLRSNTLPLLLVALLHWEGGWVTTLVSNNENTYLQSVGYFGGAR